MDLLIRCASTLAKVKFTDLVLKFLYSVYGWNWAEIVKLENYPQPSQHFVSWAKLEGRLRLLYSSSLGLYHAPILPTAHFGFQIVNVSNEILDVPFHLLPIYIVPFSWYFQLILTYASQMIKICSAENLIWGFIPIRVPAGFMLVTRLPPLALAWGCYHLRAQMQSLNLKDNSPYIIIRLQMEWL